MNASKHDEQMEDCSGEHGGCLSVEPDKKHGVGDERVGVKERENETVSWR